MFDSLRRTQKAINRYLWLVCPTPKKLIYLSFNLLLALCFFKASNEWFCANKTSRVEKKPSAVFFELTVRYNITVILALLTYPSNTSTALAHIPNDNKSCLEKRFCFCYQPQQTKQVLLLTEFLETRFEFFFFTFIHARCFNNQ